MAVIEPGLEPGVRRTTQAAVSHLALPTAAVVLAVFAASSGAGADWLQNWRTGVLFAVSAFVIVAGQFLLTQFFEARAMRMSLLNAIEEEIGDADAILAKLKVDRRD